MVKALKRQKAVVMGAEMGTGKTIQAICTAHAHANGKPYRAIVMCPGQLATKWGREVESTIPNVRVIQLKTWEDVVARTATQSWKWPSGTFCLGTGPSWAAVPSRPSTPRGG